MTGSKTASITTDEMRAAHERGETLSDWQSVRRKVAAGIEPEFDEDSPDASDLIREAIAKRRAGRLPGSGTEEQVAIRLDRDVLAAFRDGGPGWQTRINAALRDWLRQQPRLVEADKSEASDMAEETSAGQRPQPTK